MFQVDSPFLASRWTSATRIVWKSSHAANLIRNFMIEESHAFIEIDINTRVTFLFNACYCCVWLTARSFTFWYSRGNRGPLEFIGWRLLHTATQVRECEIIAQISCDINSICLPLNIWEAHQVTITTNKSIRRIVTARKPIPYASNKRKFK